MRHVISTSAVLLADCSGSMAYTDGGPMRRIDRLAQVLAHVLTHLRLDALVCFNDYPHDIKLTGHVQLPEPEGGTALDLALAHVGRMTPVPHRALVLSDGIPNYPAEALAMARTLPCIIDAYYIGPDNNPIALAFMASLAAAARPGGQSGKYDLGNVAQIGLDIRLRLTAS